MTKTIYHLLPHSFWTSRKCHSCHQFFTADDYLVQNYQLTFKQVLKTKQLSLEVQVQLAHKSCCSDCTNYLQELNSCSIPILKK